jgi:hypothetical protein
MTARLYMALLACAIALPACGGGDPLPDVPTPGIDCAAHPELCV